MTPTPHDNWEIRFEEMFGELWSKYAEDSIVYGVYGRKTEKPPVIIHKENIIDFLRREIAQAREESVLEYTDFLLKHGYVDSDVWAEKPTASERFFSQNSRLNPPQ